MTEIYKLDQIKDALTRFDPIEAMEEGFAAYSQGRTIIPPVGELIFEDPPGDVHIKYGCIKGDDYYIIKIASGFYENHKSDLPNFDGLMLLFSQKTGQLLSILLDEGHLTNVRTAAAGAVAAKYLAPKNVTGVGVFGAGIQGRMQVEYLKSITPNREIWVWGINNEEREVYRQDMENKGYSVHPSGRPEDIATRCNLIIMATPSKTPLLTYDMIRPGTHITAMGSDTPEKQELDPKILGNADIVVADSISQCSSRGEIYHSMKAGVFKKENMRELGNVITKPDLGRQTEDQITIADLTGVAIQDIQIAKAVFFKLHNDKRL